MEDSNLFVTCIWHKLYVHEKIKNFFKNNKKIIFRETSNLTNIFQIDYLHSAISLVIKFPTENNNYCEVTIFDTSKEFIFNYKILNDMEELIKEINNYV
jgi:hypothetical protein